MVYPLFIEDAWCYWVISVGALFSFVGLIVACICSCRRNDNKSEFLGLAGMVTITHPDSEEFSRNTSSEAVQTTPQDTIDGAGKRSNTANRSLPDIPKDKTGECEIDAQLRNVIYEVNENIGADPSELYATVQDKSNEGKVDKRDKQTISQQSSQDETASLYARLKTPQTSSEEHPYAQVQNVSKSENIQHTRNKINPTVDLSKPSTSASSSIPIAPPRSRRSSSHNSLLEQPILDIQAASAISGGVQANQDLPYMTPPILMSLPQPPQAQNNNPQQHFSGDSQDSKGYTSISVREPLANIIAQTKNAQQQRQAARPVTDPHYATVSDDSDEMYAAIDEQDKVYTSGSETYAQIQPMPVEINRPIQVEQPTPHVPNTLRVEEPYALAPQPPSVDSLRHVAHAHSRQASSSSATSSVANPGSPKPEKRQANSPLPPPPENPMDMYAMIDKRNKNDDRTRASIVSGKSLEDMYAKVMKKKREAGSSAVAEDEAAASVLGNAAVESSSSSGSVSRKLSLVEISRASWSSHDSIEIMRREPEFMADQQQQQQQHQQPRLDDDEPFVFDEFDLDHGYEAVVAGAGSHQAKRLSLPSIDANYETLRPLPHQPASSSGGGGGGGGVAPAAVSGITTSGLRNGIDSLPIYSMPLKHRQVSNASSEDPGYEKVRLCKRSLDARDDPDTDSEPNYESMPHEPVEPNYASVACGLGAGSDLDPNYESVSNGDPNYESVRYMSFDEPPPPPSPGERHQQEQQQQQQQQQPEEPPYERVANYKDRVDPDYERIQRIEDVSTAAASSGNADTDDEQYVQV